MKRNFYDSEKLTNSGQNKAVYWHRGVSSDDIFDTIIIIIINIALHLGQLSGHLQRLLGEAIGRKKRTNK